MYQLCPDHKHQVKLLNNGHDPTLQYPFHTQYTQSGHWRRDCDGSKQEEREQDHMRKTKENSRGRKKKERRRKSTLCKSSAPDFINSKPNPSPSHSPLIPALEEKVMNKRQEKDKDCVTNYYPTSPIYVPIYEEDAPTLVDILIPEPTPEEERNIDANRQIKTKDKMKKTQTKRKGGRRKKKRQERKKKIIKKNQPLTLDIKSL